MKYVALDFETANSSPVSACSVGWSRFEDHTLLRSRVQFIRPPKGFDSFLGFNQQVHGIDSAMVEDAPQFDAVWPVLREEIEGSVLVCHYALFDIGVLCKTLAYYGLPMPRCRYVCTVKIAQKVWPALPNHKLNTVSAALGIALNHHEAGSDAHAAGLILQKALKECRCSDVDALAQHIGMRIGMISPEGHVSCSTAQEIARQRERAAKQPQKKSYKPRAHRQKSAGRLPPKG